MLKKTNEYYVVYILFCLLATRIQFLSYYNFNKVYLCISERVKSQYSLTSF